ncbi:MAG: hypothetical protein ACLS8J_09425 [Streptococcus salivarius]
MQASNIFRCIFVVETGSFTAAVDTGVVTGATESVLVLLVLFD